MYRHAIAFLLVLAVVACAAPPAQEPESTEESGAVEETAAREQESATRMPAENEVIITVVCPAPRSDGEASVTVHPLHKLVAGREPTDVHWSYVEEGEGSIEQRQLLPMASEEFGEFPWMVEDLGAEGWSGTVIDDYYVDGVWKYTISMSCNDDEITWDPRMQIDRSG